MPCSVGGPKIEWPVRTFDPRSFGEEQRWSAVGNRRATDFGNLEIRIDTRLHRDDVIFGRRRSMNVRRSGNGTQPLCALEGLVGAAAVDRRHFRTHRSEV